MRREQGASESPTFWAISTLLARAFSTRARRILRSNGSIPETGGRFAPLDDRWRTGVDAAFLRMIAPIRHKIALATVLAQKIARKARIQFHRIVPISTKPRGS